MQNFLTWLVAHWTDIVVWAIVIAAAIVLVVKFLKLTPKQQLSRIQTALLSLVTEAERVLGTQTGKVKRSAVYSAIVKKFPILSIILSESTFDSLLDDTLNQFRELLETNDKLYEYVYNKPRDEGATIENTVNSYKELGGNSDTELIKNAVSAIENSVENPLD